MQTARNGALLTVAQCYFDVQESRGRLAGILDSVAKAKVLVKQVESLSIGLVPEIEIDRAQALLADLNHQAISAQTSWHIASAADPYASAESRFHRRAPGTAAFAGDVDFIAVLRG